MFFGTPERLPRVAESRRGRSFIASWAVRMSVRAKKEIVGEGVHMSIQFQPHSASDTLQRAGGLAGWGTKRPFEGCCYEFVVVFP